MTACVRVLNLLVFFILPAVTVHSQRYLGIATSNWSAINSLYLNPANIADCRENLSISILSLGVTVDNNLGFIPKIPDIGSAANNSNNIFTKSQQKTFSMLAPAAAVHGPGVMVSVSKKVSLALTSGIRAINQLNNFDPALYKVFTDSGVVPTGDYHARAQNFNWTAHMWSEVGLTLGVVASEGYKHRLNLGITIRRLGGIGYIAVTGRNLDINYKKDSNIFSAANSDIDFSSNVVNDSSAVFKRITPAGLFSKFFGESSGGGMSTDIGLTYRYRIGEPEPSDYMESDLIHDLVFSVAVTDFGAIRYYNGTRAVLNVNGSGNLTGNDIKGSVSSVGSVVDFAHRHGFNVDTTTSSRKVYLPAALVASADVQVYGRFFVNLLYIGNLANRMNFGNSYYNQFTLTPRYDFHKMTVALPVTYSVLAHDLKVGIAARYTGFFIGSDDVMAVLNKYQYGFGFYVGGYIPIFKRHNDPMGMHWR